MAKAPTNTAARRVSKKVRKNTNTSAEDDVPVSARQH